MTMGCSRVARFEAKGKVCIGMAPMVLFYVGLRSTAGVGDGGLLLAFGLIWVCYTDAVFEFVMLFDSERCRHCE